ncbi:uracil-DNA glycosylase-like [Mercenaria mercenaria]|uniref:uracil-DNA glycosylase-like n=1 Tax=Mercenaria mercenaria TaxID=6596 RepID=UPI00234E622A|nr:uracil-DNA glycosylase-like [Mercenaria mercenaria]
MHPAMQTSVQPVMQTSVQPVMQPAMQTLMQPVMQPVMQTSMQTVMQPAMQPVMQPAMQPVMQPAMQPVMQPAMQPAMPNPYANLSVYLTEPSWGPYITPYVVQPEQNLTAAFANGQQIFPAPTKIFTALNLTPLNRVKVVILGQDPFTDGNKACGLAFSVPAGCPIPPSLRNIVTCLQNDPDVNFTQPDHGDLTMWADQGVLLLNTILTAGQTPLSHEHFGWEILTDNVIKTISDTQHHVVFILLGAHAKSKIPLIDSWKHTILTASHPAARGEPFIRSNIFSSCNQALQLHWQSPINWQIPPISWQNDITEMNVRQDAQTSSTATVEERLHSSNDSVDKIIFCVYDIDNWGCYQELMPEIFPPSDEIDTSEGERILLYFLLSLRRYVY